MKKYTILILFISFAVFAGGQSPVRSLNFNERVNDVVLTGTIKYKPAAYQDVAYVEYALSNVKVLGYYYGSTYYSGGDLPGITFPMPVNDGFVKASCTFNFELDYISSGRETMLIKSSGLSDGSLGGSIMSDHLFGGFDNELAKFLKSHGITKKGEWEHKIKMNDISIKEVNISNILKIKNAIKQKEKAEEYSELMQEGDKLFSWEEYEDAIEQFNKARYLSSDDSEAVEKIAKAKAAMKQAEDNAKYENFINSARKSVQREEYKDAIESYTQALDYAASAYEEAEIKAEIKSINQYLIDQKKALSQNNSIEESVNKEEYTEKDQRDEMLEFNKKMSEKRAEEEIQNELDYYEGRRNTQRIEAERQRTFMQSMDNIARIGGELLGNYIGHTYERKEQERLEKLEEERIKNERIVERKRIEKERRIAEDERLNKLKNKPEYVSFVENALNDVFYFDSSGKEVDQKNATFEVIYIKQENGFYVAKYFNLKEEILDFDISYEIIPNPFIESVKTGPSIKYGPLDTKIGTLYYYRNKLKQKTLNFWWTKKMYFEFYNYKNEKVFASGEILRPEIMNVSSSGIISNMEYKITSERGKFKRYRFTFDSIGNVESLYITNEKSKIEDRYKFDQ